MQNMDNLCEVEADVWFGTGSQVELVTQLERVGLGGVISGYHLRLDHAISFAGSAVLCISSSDLFPNMSCISRMAALMILPNQLLRLLVSRTVNIRCWHAGCVGISHNSILRRPTVANSGQLAKRRTLESIGKVFANLLQTNQVGFFETIILWSCL